MKLPPLPPCWTVNVWELYKADQMREYAAAAYRAGQEEIKEAVANMAWERRGHFASDFAARSFASFVRALPLDDQP